MQFFLTCLKRCILWIDRINKTIGQCAAYLVLGLVLLVSFDVMMRYLLHSGSIALQELAWHIFSMIFLLGAGYTLQADQHVRLDMLYRSRWMSPYRRSVCNFFGAVLFLIPFCLLVIGSSVPFVYQSYIHAENSPDPGGLAYRWIMKSMIQFGFLLLLLQGLANAGKDLQFIINAWRGQGSDL